MTGPDVTVVMTPRDRFSYTQDAVEAVYSLSDRPFHFIFVDGGFPASIRKYLLAESKKRNFRYIQRDRYLAPNHAKNLALPYLSGKYAVFIDNDCIPMNHGWLGSLVRCAEETEAAMVSPLVCEGWPEARLVHFAGGQNHVTEVEANGKKQRIIQMSIDGQGQKLPEFLAKTKRHETELTEMHAMLVRVDWLKKIGQFDPGILGSRDHVDFCLEVTTRGGKIFMEPSSQVRFLPEPPLGPALKITDLAFYALRWSDEWWMGSLDHLKRKWQVAEEGYLAKRYDDAGWRRKAFLSRPLARKLTLGIPMPVVEAWIDKQVLAWTHKLVQEYNKNAAADSSSS